MIARNLATMTLAIFLMAACGESTVVVNTSTDEGNESPPGNNEQEQGSSDFAERFAAVYEADTAPQFATVNYFCTCSSTPNPILCDDQERETGLEIRVECLLEEFEGLEPPAAMEPYLQCYETLLPQRQQCLELVNQATQDCSGLPDCIENFDSDSSSCESLFNEELRQWLQATGAPDTCDL